MQILSVIALFLAASATSILGVRDLPGRYIHSKTFNHTSLNTDDLVTTDTDISPDTVVVLKPDYIKGFLVFNSLNVVQNAPSENAPLVSKFTNLDRHLSDETNLKSWTRYLAEQEEEPVELPEVPSVEEVDLEISRFIDYLVTNRNFKKDDLQFLREENFHLSYDEIEDELAEIRERNEEAEIIEEPLQVVESLALSHFLLLPIIISLCLACF